ncbi:MAG: hypothetical protein U5L96_09485 [Owenweeksia sp.]|nr:hypothetical protein [Owenweeksia sp.]
MLHLVEQVSICEGDTFGGYWNSGKYISHFTANNGCDSVHRLEITVVPDHDTTFAQTICQGDTFLGYYQSGSIRG